MLDIAPTTHAGNPPLGTVDAGSLAVLGGISIGLLLAGFNGFHRRDLPQR
ncbi:hypothetical protein ACIA5C_20905 [Actinoplanes sp. NPDC051343]